MLSSEGRGPRPNGSRLQLLHPRKGGACKGPHFSTPPCRLLLLKHWNLHALKEEAGLIEGLPLLSLMACRRQPAASEAQKDKSLIVSLCLKCACGFAQAPISGLWFSPIWNCGLWFCPSWRGKSVAHSPNSSVTKLHRWLVEVGDYTISGAHDARPGGAYIPVLEKHRSQCLLIDVLGEHVSRILAS